MQRSAAHEEALKQIVQYLQVNVVEKKEIVQLTFLHRLYVNILEDRGFLQPNFLRKTLRSKIEKCDIAQYLGFTTIDTGRGFISYTIIFNCSIAIGEAIKKAYHLSTVDKLHDVALFLRKSIQNAFRVGKDFPWPPTAADLDVEPDIPEQVTKFLNYVISGTDSTTSTAESDHAHRIVLSIGQGICRAVTNGEWKFPKHILLAETVRHLYRSKKLLTILNRLGNCESHNFTLELEGAMAKALQEVSTHLTPRIVQGEDNLVFHSEWDNLNKVTSNIHESNIVNSTGGIMIQEVKSDVDLSTDNRQLPQYERSKTRSQPSCEPEILPSFHLYQRVGPTLPVNAVYNHPLANVDIYKKHLNEHHVWFFARVLGSSGEKQLVPSYGGFVSATGMIPKRKSTIDFYTPIHQPFTDYAVIQELLKRSEEATDAVGQHYVLNTFDLGGCMKALPIIWRFPDKFKRHVVTPGPFHTCMNYIGMLTGHKCRGSGYAEILIESGLATSGCLKNIMSGKAYAKALFALKTVCEAMQRLLLEKYLAETEEVNVPFESLVKLVTKSSRENLDTVLADEMMQNFLHKYLAYEDKVKQGHLGKTAQFWMSVIDHYRLILMLLDSVKKNNLSLFHKCNSDMADLFFAYDGPNYSKYLVWLDLFLTNIDKSHPGAKELLQNGGIAVARSLLPGALSAVDKTMEETFMKFAKSHGGLGGIFHMFGAYERWCKTTSNRAQYYEKMLEMCGLIDDPECPVKGTHRELLPSEIKKSEEAVQRTMAAIKNFTNPFEIADKDRLYSLASGAVVSLDVETDLLQAESLGKKRKEEFIKNRFVNGSPRDRFFDQNKKLKLKTMEACNKTVKLTTSDGRLIQYKEQSDLAFMLLIKSQLLDEPLDLDELVCYSLFPVPPSLGTSDGFLAKTRKAKMANLILKDYTDPVTYPDNALHIDDGNATMHMLRDVPATFGEIIMKIFDQMVAKKNFIFSTDSYHPDSIKAQERIRRGCSQKYIVHGPLTRKPTDFKLFLQNDSNKQQFFQLMLEVAKTNDASDRIAKCGTAIIIVDGKAYQLKISAEGGEVECQEIYELRSNQEETDTRVVLYLKYAISLGYKSAVVRTPDSDIFFILLFHANSINLIIYLDTGTGKNRKLINVSEIAKDKGQEYCSTMLGLYDFSGQDAISAFKGKGKVGPLKKLTKNPKYMKAFQRLGDDWTVDDTVYKDLEAFTCLMYGYPREKSVNVVRSKMLKKMVGVNEKLTLNSKVDLSKLPPCADNLLPHVQRANYRTATFKRADQPIFWKPKPFEDNQGWIKEGDTIEPCWSCADILPPSLIDLVEDTVAETLDADNEEVDLELEDDDTCFEE